MFGCCRYNSKERRINMTTKGKTVCQSESKSQLYCCINFKHEGFFLNNKCTLYSTISVIYIQIQQCTLSRNNNKMAKCIKKVKKIKAEKDNKKSNIFWQCMRKTCPRL